MNTFEKRQKKSENDNLKFKKKLVKLCWKEIDWNNIHKSIIHNIFPDNNLTKLFTYKECISNVSKLDIEQINKLKLLLESYYFYDSTNSNKFEKVFEQTLITSNEIEKFITKNDLVINIGSSLDKTAFLLEFKKYNIKYIPFSRDYIWTETKNENNKKNILNNNISKNLCKSHYINFLNKYGITQNNVKNKKIVIIDYLFSGNSIISFINLFCECLKINKDNIFIIGTYVSFKNQNNKIKNILNNLNYKLNYKLLKIHSNVFAMSKQIRCVPKLIGTNDKKNIMSNDEIMYCNVVRLLFTYEYMKIKKNLTI
jgi:hypothetical protein